jgi:ABC-type lipopolysaccharide export system ATPase subunit
VTVVVNPSDVLVGEPITGVSPVRVTAVVAAAG